MRSFLDEVNFPRIQERFDEYWLQENHDRPLLFVTAPRDKRREPDFAQPDTLDGRWLDIEFQIKSHELAMENTFYAGEAIPAFWPNIGPDSFTAFLGADLRFVDYGTSWVAPFVEDLSEWEPTLEPDNKWWRFMLELMDAACEAGKDRYLISVPDIHHGGDSIAAARHPDKLALDLYDKPEVVQRVMKRLTEICVEICDVYFEKLFRVQEGCTTWIPAYSRGRYFALQNDFSGLSSPPMFKEFFVEELTELAQYLDNSIYHLDGPTSVGNLEHLVQIEPLDGVQWVPGAGSKAMSEWLDLLLAIQDGGKCMQINCGAGEVEFLTSHLKPEGVFIVTGCRSEDDARALVRQVEKA